MKNSAKAVIICVVTVCISLLSVNAFALEKQQSAPVLKSISFKNAEIEGEFDPNVNEYNIVLDDPSVTPTLKSYEIEGEAYLLVNNNYDEHKRQTGIVVTFQHEKGNLLYTFNYTNCKYFEKSSNNYLAEVKCNGGIVYPEISNDVTEYTIYVPKDLTKLLISASAQDVSAYCEAPPKEILLTAEQELDIPLVVTASNGDVRAYSFEVKRTKKTTKEFQKIIESGDIEQFVKGERFYQKPAFIIAVSGTLGAVLIIFIFIKLFRRFTIEVGDSDEKDFFTTTDN